ncbi:MarR family winged helix-turn-helix transcriptional regulator [Pseudoalteromonas sp. G4]|uniref:MarR family winged helix-turn-helix transcriptional regulator n=1 Tax=Pseudoalteromonas sp. G4 TaxID=2992761 RepID=UPI00237EB639|nr:MarR family transcriptional regulator [Pseudoalteromonas sp. G4]MDE3273379.1 MarR family transcriptional regulator [Pseudoalteromonas sp. G4]
MASNADQLLENQLCFPIYAASRLVTRLYQPELDKHKLTYPQYVILLILWQQDGVTVGEIGQQAILNNNTLTPILKRMEQSDLIERRRDEWDERKVRIYLTQQGHSLQQSLSCLPSQLVDKVGLDLEKAKQLKALLGDLMDKLNDQV